MKNSTRSIWKIGRVVALGLMIATPAMAMPWGHGEDFDRGDHGRMGAPFGMHRGSGFDGDMGLHLIQMGKRLELTDEQETKILELSQKFRADIEANRETCKVAHEKLSALRKSKTFDEAAIRAAMEDAYPSMVEGVILHAKYRDEIGKILTDEQKEKMETFRDRMHKRFKENRKDRCYEDGPDYRDHRRGKPGIE
jgi:Spy/CpxP family protein refolding chaperone